MSLDPRGDVRMQSAAQNTAQACADAFRPPHDPSAPVETETITPDQAGWLKRSDIGPRVWEQPDGQLFQFPPGRPQTLTVLKNGPLGSGPLGGNGK